MRTRARAYPATPATPWVTGLDISLTAPGVCAATGDPRGKVGDGLFAEATMFRAGETLRGPERLSVVSGAIWAWVLARGRGRPGDLYVTEGYAFSASHAHSMGEIGGCIRRVIWESGGNLLVVPPSTLKKFLTGKGAGDKNIVMKHVWRRWGFDSDDDNECDAFGCAMLGLYDEAGPQYWSAIDRDILTKKVIRFAGRGQSRWAPAPVATPKKSRGPRVSF
jgi:Holliday junction resolvasome RuvABC endonuclease subunit